MKSLTDVFTLANGVTIPCVGFGTWQSPDGPVATASVRTALEIGYRHVDTASAYFNEASVACGIKESGIPRDAIFLTTKLWNLDQGYESTLTAFEASLERLETDYLDLYLIHWPIPAEHHHDWKTLLPETWRAMEELYAAKKIRAIGVSNFRPHHIEALAAKATLFPMVNQIEFHPGETQAETVAWCRQRDILIQAWSPLAQGRVFDLPLLQTLAAKYEKSPAQICLRFELQFGVNPLPKSVTPERIAQNADLFDFALTDDEVAQIAAIPPCGGAGFDPDNFTFPSKFWE